MLGSGGITSLMVEVSLRILLAIFMKVTGLTLRLMEWENLSREMEILTLVHGKVMSLQGMVLR